MNNFLFQIYRIVVPKPLRTIIRKKYLRNKIKVYFASLPENQVNGEQKEILQFLENNEIRIFPYSFHDDYSPDKIEVFYDQERKMRFVLQNGKKLYFKKRWKEKKIKQAYSDLMREQDPNSPHRYLSGEFMIGKEDVVADIGAAEGNFSLAVVEEVKKIYLFEYDSEWIDALKATFAPWPDKVEIIDKFVTDHNDNSHIRFDTFFENKRDVTFLKIDVDGAEEVVLNSCKGLFEIQQPLKIALCTYHKNDDEKELSSALLDHGFTVIPSKGYMINYYDKKMKAPYLRRGLVRAVR
jgi:hypothetical protein